MTTDTKAVARWDWDSEDMHEYPNGDYVLFTDHERVVANLTKNHKENLDSWLARGAEISRLRADLAESRAELDALNEAQAVGDGTISGSLLHWHQRALAAESALTASRAEVEGMVLIQISDAKSLINYVTHSPTSKMASHRVRALIEMKEKGNV